ncbi:GNAT family N-acetyltransferase [Sediminibacillus halophilus]|uniref:Acetyltransferase (GNAT) family protein n=1 Tax=Sediminibacillus halophilus TaxID=482461 RepID=A0A1G9NKU2_9BACI|nr:GNAT family N-acetyltransferase [Sediminibacillus halophilus]SDL87226.1 Acetyltransferase (GNAT) family protein [Sediminibacillus halophilus]
MNITYENVVNIPEDPILEGILLLHDSIFEDGDNLAEKITKRQQLLFTLAFDHDTVIGYKIGYPLDEKKFYSWLGGVNANYRNMGIASALMHHQHGYLREKGYDRIQTKTMNRWRSMLLLNIKTGFAITGTYLDTAGELKIVLEKELN